MAPTSSQMNPNIATRANNRVPLRLSAVVMAMRMRAIAVVATGVLSSPNNCARNGATPVATPAIVQHSAQAYTHPAIHAQRLPTRRRAQGYRPPEIGNCETISPKIKQTIS